MLLNNRYKRDFIYNYLLISIIIFFGAKKAIIFFFVNEIIEIIEEKYSSSYLIKLFLIAF